jgi:hypothetical protein
MAYPRITARRPSAWWYMLPPVLLLVVFCVGGFVLSVTSTAGVRAASPVAGPGDTVHFTMERDVAYTAYQRAAPGHVGSDCTLSPDGREAEGLRAGIGGPWRSLFTSRPAAVTVGGDRYEFAMQLSDLNRVGLTLSCRGGPIVVESRADVRWTRIVTAAVLAGVAAAATGGIAWLRRRRRVA